MPGRQVEGRPPQPPRLLEPDRQPGRRPRPPGHGRRRARARRPAPRPRSGSYASSGSGWSRRTLSARWVSSSLTAPSGRRGPSDERGTLAGPQPVQPALARRPKSTGRRLSGSTRLCSHSSLPWYTSGTPGTSRVTSFAASALLQPGRGHPRQRGRRAPSRTSRVVERRVDGGMDGALVVLVGRGPPGPVAGLAHRLLGVARAGGRAVAVDARRARHRGPPARAGSRSPDPGSGHQLEQPSQGGVPLVGDLRQHADPGAHVLAALRVVGGAGGHRVRPVDWRRVAIAAWNSSGDTANTRGVASDLVERRQPRPAVERTVLDPLGHHHAAGLLEALRRAGGRRRQDRRDWRRACRRGPGGAYRARANASLEVLATLRAGTSGRPGSTRAAPRPRRRHLVSSGLDATGESVRRDRPRWSRSTTGVSQAGAARALDQARSQLAGDPTRLGVQDRVGHLALGAVDQVRPVDRRATQPGLEGVERLLAGGVDEHPVDECHRVVPGRARPSPTRSGATRPARGSSRPARRRHR